MAKITKLTPMEKIFENYLKMEVEDFYEWMFENESDLLKQEKFFLIDAFVTRIMPFKGKDIEFYFKEKAKIYNESYVRECISDKLNDLSEQQHEQVEKFIDAIIRQN
jgi:hypothetical protein